MSSRLPRCWTTSSPTFVPGAATRRLHQLSLETREIRHQEQRKAAAKKTNWGAIVLMVAVLIVVLYVLVLSVTTV